MTSKIILGILESVAELWVRFAAETGFSPEEAAKKAVDVVMRATDRQSDLELYLQELDKQVQKDVGSK